MGGLLGWHLLILLAVLALVALVVFALFWVVRLGARRGAADALHRDRPDAGA
ncbi:hypothetical protein [Microbacterium sp. MM2322]|uniref:hypothetical protein n=1 Tax=Microbacterium sp. MM2322 TaxID=3157631 RepID=UPI0032D58AC4